MPFFSIADPPENSLTALPQKKANTQGVSAIGLSVSVPQLRYSVNLRAEVKSFIVKIL
jgi:hypothetical protein